jgi:hypothetical protein
MSRADKHGDRNKTVGKVPNTFATLGALSLLILPFSTGRAATALLSPTEKSGTGSITAEQVYKVLNADQTDYFRHVNVDVRNGVVTLSGYVWSTPAIHRAEELAASLPDVTRVIDQIELERNGLET